MRCFWLPLLAAVALAGCITRPFQDAPRIDAPPPGKVLVNFHRPDHIIGSYVWDGSQLVGVHDSYSLLQHVCDPGEHYFVLRVPATGWLHTYVIKAQVAADGTYDIISKRAGGGGIVSVEPVAGSDFMMRDRLAKWERDEEPVKLPEKWIGANQDFIAEERGIVEGVIADLKAGRARKVDYAILHAEDRRKK